MVRVLSPRILLEGLRDRIPAPPSRVWRRRVLIGLGARRTPSCRCREGAFVLIRPVRRPIDSFGVSGLACRPPASSVSPRRSTSRGSSAHGVAEPPVDGYSEGIVLWCSVVEAKSRQLGRRKPRR